MYDCIALIFICETIVPYLLKGKGAFLNIKRSLLFYLLLNSEQTIAVATATFSDSEVVLLVEKLGI